MIRSSDCQPRPPDQSGPAGSRRHHAGEATPRGGTRSFGGVAGFLQRFAGEGDLPQQERYTDRAQSQTSKGQPDRPIGRVCCISSGSCSVPLGAKIGLGLVLAVGAWSLIFSGLGLLDRDPLRVRSRLRRSAQIGAGVALLVLSAAVWSWTSSQNQPAHGRNCCSSIASAHDAVQLPQGTTEGQPIQAAEGKNTVSRGSALRRPDDAGRSRNYTGPLPEPRIFTEIHRVDSLSAINNLNGRGERIRTSGPCLPKTVLYQAELLPDGARS